MKYQIKIEKDAQKFLKKLPRPDETRVLKAIAKLPDEGDRKQMKGHPGCVWVTTALSTRWTTGS